MCSTGQVFGVEQGFATNAIAGLFFGYAHADLISSGKNTQIETDSFFLGLYGQDSWQGIDIGLSLNLGYEDHDSSVHNAYLGASLRYRLRERLHVEAEMEYSHDMGEVSERALSGSVLVSYEF